MKRVIGLTAALVGCGPGGFVIDGDGGVLAEEIVGGRVSYAAPAVGRANLAGQACTATLVATNVILLAGHCVRYGTAAGTFRVYRGQREYEEYRVVEARSYQRNGASESDVALARLSEEVPADVAAPLSLARSYPRGGVPASLWGFGCTSRPANCASGSAPNDQLKRVTTVSYGYPSRAICPSDSGGPLIVDGYGIVGVAAGYDCPRGRPEGRDQFGNVVALRSTLLSQIETWSAGTCGGYRTCDACASAARCGWCASSNRCMRGAWGGPAGGTCAPASWRWVISDCRR